MPISHGCTRYVTVPQHGSISAGGSAWTKVGPALDGAKPASWLQEYQFHDLPSVPIEALGESCFSSQQSTAPQDLAARPSAGSAGAHPADLPLGLPLGQHMVCLSNSAHASYLLKRCFGQQYLVLKRLHHTTPPVAQPCARKM